MDRLVQTSSGLIEKIEAASGKNKRSFQKFFGLLAFVLPCFVLLFLGAIWAGGDWDKKFDDANKLYQNGRFGEAQMNGQAGGTEAGIPTLTA